MNHAVEHLSHVLGAATEKLHAAESELRAAEQDEREARCSAQEWEARREEREDHLNQLVALKRILNDQIERAFDLTIALGELLNAATPPIDMAELGLEVLKARAVYNGAHPGPVQLSKEAIERHQNMPITRAPVDQEAKAPAGKPYRKVHELNTSPEFFGAVVTQTKNFEVRKDDGRGFEVGDLLRLRERDKCSMTFTGAAVDREVTFILREAEHPGVAPGFVVMSIAVPSPSEAPR